MWLEMLPNLQAEYDLRFSDQSGRSISQIRRLAYLATGDYEQAKQIAMTVYTKRLEARLKD